MASVVGVPRERNRCRISQLIARIVEGNLETLQPFEACRFAPRLGHEYAFNGQLHDAGIHEKSEDPANAFLSQARQANVPLTRIPRTTRPRYESYLLER